METDENGSSLAAEITPIKVGDVVYCAEYYNDGQRENCWINGKTVSAIDDDGRAHVEGESKWSHQVFFLRHEGERTRNAGEEVGRHGI